MKMTDRRVLAVGAHPDDLTLGCYGTLAKLAEHNEVCGLILSGAGTKQAQEAHDALEGVCPMLALRDLPPTEFPSRNREVAIIDTLISEFEIDTIIGHAPWDHHQDHVTTWRMILAASRRRPVSILGFHAISATPDFPANLAVDITDQWEAKLAATRCHKSQCHKPYFAPGYLEAWHHDKRATAAGLRLVELFHIFQEWWV
jgi:LmbE family N-acetylglucosaminyl deacetylase